LMSISQMKLTTYTIISMLLLCGHSLSAQFIPAGTTSLGLNADMSGQHEKFSTEGLAYILQVGLNGDYYLLHNFALGVNAGIAKSNSIVSIYYGPYLKWAFLRGPFFQFEYRLYSGDTPHHQGVISLGYAALFNSNFSIEPIVSYYREMKDRTIADKITFGIGARYYFKQK